MWKNVRRKGLGLLGKVGLNFLLVKRYVEAEEESVKRNKQLS